MKVPTGNPLMINIVFKRQFFSFQSTLVCGIDVHARLLFWEKIPLCTALFWSARLLFLRKKSPCTFTLQHVYWYLPCTFINFEKKNPPARPNLSLLCDWKSFFMVKIKSIQAVDNYIPKQLCFRNYLQSTDNWPEN